MTKNDVLGECLDDLLSEFGLELSLIEGLVGHSEFDVTVLGGQLEGRCQCSNEIGLNYTFEGDTGPSVWTLIRYFVETKTDPLSSSAEA